MSTYRVFSGIQPTGVPHLGNYLGAIKHWVNIQTKMTSSSQKNLVMFCVVDLHSCTTVQDSKTMKDNIFNMVASLLACGIDPEKSLIFQQSQVPYHTDLAWFLSCLTPMGQLKRMHQWKSKKSKDRDRNYLGLFSYPVLMAADILLYKSTHVPVGEDQLQHIELARDLCDNFNKKYTYTFPQPKAVLTQSSRVMSLKNPLEKMSKSHQSVSSRIELTDNPNTISEKLKKAVTDSEPYISEDLSDRPGVRNLVDTYCALSGMTVKNVVRKYQDIQYFTRDLKNDVTDLVIDTIKPIQSEFAKLQNDRPYLEEILRTGSFEANTVARATMDEVYRNIGLR